MPKGPQGQKRPADAVARAVMIGKIATGEISEEIPSGDGRAAGGHKRAKVLSEADRKKIARRAAEVRWSKQGMECDMKHTALKESSATVGREAVRMYPNNSLREPIRAFENTVFDLVKKTFTK